MNRVSSSGVVMDSMRSEHEDSDAPASGELPESAALRSDNLGVRARPMGRKLLQMRNEPSETWFT